MAVLGIDIGGSGIKGAPVDTRAGRLVEDRFRVKTPRSGEPDAVVECIGAVAEHWNWRGPVGVTFPGVVRDGVIGTAVNLHPSWVGTNLPALLEERLGLAAVALNDADAAGVAEVAHGAAKGVPGLVVVLTFGTGVGSAMLIDGRLVPNTEIGHLELGGADAERQVAESVREKKGWSWKKWAGHANDYLALVEKLFWPDLIVVGGGIAKQPDDWLPLLETRAPVRVAALGNLAGIVGAAMAAEPAAARVAAD
jgi:polyphosphate glucokinase